MAKQRESLVESFMYVYIFRSVDTWVLLQIVAALFLYSNADVFSLYLDSQYLRIQFPVIKLGIYLYE